MIIHEDALLDFIQKCAEEKLGGYETVILPVTHPENENGNRCFSTFSKDKNISLDGYRSVDPLKMLFYMPREKVSPANQKTEKRVVLGAKACDLEALAVLDAAMVNEDFVDPVYQAWRDETLIVSTDCTDIGPTCHCNLLDGKPYPEKGYDLNLSKVGDKYFVSTRTEKGETFLKLIEQYGEIEKSTNANQDTVNENRQNIINRLKNQNKGMERSGKYDKLRSDVGDDWESVSESCIGCGACTNICPTCYCLILNDETKAQEFVKVRSYDSCQWHGYARVAGGDSPRPKMHQRFRNRYLCKFLFMKSNFDLFGCTGCGRCTDACAGNIDFRKVVRRVGDGEKMEVVD